MNKFRRCIGRISSEICLKMDYFGSYSPQNRQALGAPPPDPLAPAAGGFAPRPPFRLIDYRLCKTLLPLKLLVDANDWPLFGKTKLIFYIICPLPPPKKRFRATVNKCIYLFFVKTTSICRRPFQIDLPKKIEKILIFKAHLITWFVCNDIGSKYL